MIFYTNKFFSSFLVVSSLFFYGCESYNNITEEPPSIDGNISDKAIWYETQQNDVVDMFINFDEPNEYLCAPYDSVNSNPRGCTFEDINNDLDPIDDYEPVLHVNMSTSDFNQTTSNNATFKIKGGFTRTATQKSYSLKLDSKELLYLEQRKFMLTKSESDRSRLRNKVAFDLFREIPNITSLQVNFLHIFINGVDYGLFNQAEAMRKEYLVHRGWNPDDHIYNANNFFFQDLPALALDDKGEPLDPEAFEKIIEIKNGKDHRKLLEMIKAVNSTEDINSVIDKYFDRENYLTWLAVNLLLGDKDAIQHNYYLYNPVNSNKFYFLPWDYDGAWASKKYLSRTEYGISVWWSVVLHQKFFSNSTNLDELYAKTDQIRQEYLSDEKVQTVVDKYIETVVPFQDVEPDSIKNSSSRCRTTAQELVTRIQDSVDLYKSTIGSPMPFHQMPSYNTRTHTFSASWETSVDLEGDNIVYDLELSSGTPENVIFKKDGLKSTSYQEDMTLENGTYYLKVISREVENVEHYQLAYDKISVNDIFYFGIAKFEVQ